MATAAPSPAADQAGDLLQKLTLGSQPKTVEIPEPTKKPTSNQYGSIESGNTNNQISSERSVTPSVQDFTDPAICYVPNGYPSAAYYYGGGFDGTVNDWDEYSRYANPDGVEMNPAVYGENGSLLYHHGYGYAPYGPYSPAASPVPMGTDGQLYGPQHYQYSPYFQPHNPTSGAFAPTPVAASEGDVKISVTTDKKSLSTDPVNENLNGVANGGGIKGNSGAGPLKSNHQNQSFGSNNGSYGRSGRVPASGYQDPRYGFDGLRSFHWMDGPMYSDGQSRLLANSTNTSSVSNGVNNFSSRNSSYGANSHFMGLHHPRPMSGMTATQGLINRMYPNKVYGQYGNVMRSGMAFGSHGYDSRTNSRAWPAVDNKYKPRGRSGGCYGYGNENIDGLNELNRGPRAKSFKNQKCYSPAVLAVKGQNMMTNGPNDDEKDATIVTPDRAQYNRAEFLETYADAKFFIIKSYSEDDVHKSIKYNVWASTPNGNKKLDAAYQEAQEKIGDCPIFLFFSVNTSGQFVGLAEMVGPVDFHKNVEYWQQDKWNGCFSVKWHIVKDVPNSVLKHIILENNENKPVTNSRDTQEVKLEPGLKMLKLFKEHTSKTCILDDFGFYEARQKTIQEKKAKQQQFQRQINSLMQIWEGRPMDEKKEGSLIDLKTQKSMEVVKELIKPSNDQGREESVVKTGDAPKGAKPVISENRVLANGC